ncbi:hypothetical protein V6C42_16305 [Pseudoclostridium thermosuccinogenes]|uniref:hypothetical protein n=1 Tax=Clostridium thermosuccinogenes TaxID=84032 RepID=UPI00137478AE|nr:hypothetical protein [Pseudoclostridium thermosuccinogenes]
MKSKKSKPITQPAGFKGESVPEKDDMDHDPTGRYMRKNPYKTPPNNMTTKGK